VAERLGEVAGEPVRRRVVLLAQQTEIVRETDESRRQRPGIAGAPAAGGLLDQPERADQERVLGTGQTV
jgi:hypothetical protein